MLYDKKPTTYEEQVKLLQERGLGGDPATIQSRLESVNYYRLSGYWYPFRKPDPLDSRKKLDTFHDGASIDKVWYRYVFDRRLKLLLIDAIERFEIDVRTRLAYHHAHAHGPFAYAQDRTTLPGLGRNGHKDYYIDFLKLIRDQFTSSDEEFVEHFKTKYGDKHTDMPIWCACELMSFGNTFSFYRGCSVQIQKLIAARYGVEDVVMESWLRTFNVVRNVCAHHGRIWNRTLGVRPMIPHARKHKQWHDPVVIQSGKTFALLSVARYCLKIIAPQSGWRTRLQQLLDTYPNVPLTGMGFPKNWQESPIWQP
ncbi:MAG: Abi family protein [Gemmatales bacterium]